ncbi:MAG: hypothetical protein FJZ63_07180, partial [Chlamydiae bacterium]|nr:hypothetical protein [Chlamydiota bacterium]
MTAVPTGGYFFSSALWQQDCGPEMDKARGRCALAARVVSVVAITGALAGAAAIFYGTTIAIISGCALNFFGALSGCSLCISGFLALYSFG